MSLSLLEATQEAYSRRQARRHFMPFVRYTKQNYRVNWHHELIAKKLEKFEQDVRDRKSPRLLIRTPPRGGKSELVSRKFPAWCLGRNPDWQIIGTTYNDDLAADMGGDAKDCFDSPEFKALFEPRLKSDSTAKDNWKTDKGGIYIGAGVGGGITGRGAHVFIIDDPYKDAKDAWSGATRKRIWDWFTSTASTRLMSGGGILMILTSWHDDGIDNKLLREQEKVGEKWEVIDIPAMMDAMYVGRHPEDPREPGESYWPDDWPVWELEKIRRRDEYVWSALYQQRAIPEGGNIVGKHQIRLWRRMPDDMDEIYLSWDLAFKKSQESSRVAGHVWGRKGADFYLLDRDTKVRDFLETLDAFEAMCRKWPRALVKLVEDKANGPALQSMLQHKINGLIMINPDNDKTGRFRAVAPVFASGNVYAPDPEVHPWAQEIIEEWTRFPNSEYNDDTDATSQALAYYVVPGVGPKKWKGWK